MCDRLSVLTPHAAELGFFLNPDRLRVQGTYVLPALQSVLTLWSAHITLALDPDNAQAREQTLTALLSEAQTQLGSALSTVDAEPDPTIILHVIQTGVLLAYYMQRIGRMVGARYYASGTWVLVMMLKLYQSPHLSVGAREVEDEAPRGSVGSTHANRFADCARLAPASDGIEAEERTRAFWAVYALDRWFGVVCEFPFRSLAIDGNVGSVMTVSWPGMGGTTEVSVLCPLSLLAS